MMKKLIFLLVISSVLLVSCKSVEISVFNNSEVDRVNEMVEICLCQLKGFNASKIVIYDAQGKEMPSQILYKGADEPQALIFPVSLKAGVESVFTVKEGTPQKIAPKTNVRFVSERKGDMSWENDRIGFRMFGPASADENLSNGVDVWLKRTSNLVLDKWYQNNLSGKASYHLDNGEGLDCYDLKNNTLGAGGIAPYSNDSLWTALHFDRYKILDNGPLRSSFVLYYDAIAYGSKKLKAELMIIQDAGSNLNEAVVVYTGDTTDIKLAAGVFLHDSTQNVAGDVKKGYIGYAENVFTQDQKMSPAGRCYTGVIFPHPVAEVKQVKKNMVGIVNYTMGEEFRYYFGAGWSKFGFKNDMAWFQYLSEKQTAIQQPLKVKILK